MSVLTETAAALGGATLESYRASVDPVILDLLNVWVPSADLLDPACRAAVLAVGTRDEALVWTRRSMVRGRLVRRLVPTWIEAAAHAVEEDRSYGPSSDLTAHALRTAAESLRRSRPVFERRTVLAVRPGRVVNTKTVACRRVSLRDEFLVEQTRDASVYGAIVASRTGVADPWHTISQDLLEIVRGSIVWIVQDRETDREAEEAVRPTLDTSGRQILRLVHDLIAMRSP